MTTCPRCSGSGKAPWVFAGRVVMTVRCSLCQGTGRAGAAAKGRRRGNGEADDFFPATRREED